MVVLHAFLALAAGFAAMVALIAISSAVLRKFTPSWVSHPTSSANLTARAEGGLSAGYIFVNLGSSFLAAAAGGYVTAWLALANPLIHVLALAITVLLLSALSALQQRAQRPIWFMLVLVALTPLGVFAGGMVRLRVLGIL